MPVVCLVRHGQASFGASDYDVLSPLGHRQSGIVAAELARRELRSPIMVSGSLARQRDTAAGIVEVTGWGPVAVDARWDEYDHVGLIEGETARDDGQGMPADNPGVQRLLDVALQHWIDAPAGLTDGGWQAFAAAGQAALAEVLAGLEPGRDAIVVTSGGVIAGVVAAVLGASATDVVVGLNRVAVNTGITTLLAGRGGVSLSSYNDHAHLLGARRDLLTYR